MASTNINVGGLHEILLKRDFGFHKSQLFWLSSTSTFGFLDKAADKFSIKSVGGTMTGEIDKDQFGNPIGLTK